MFDILEAIYYDNTMGLRGKTPLEPPYSEAEDKLRRRLQTLDAGTARELKREIRALAIEQRDEAFHTGARFGAQLAIQLLEEV